MPTDKRVFLPALTSIRGIAAWYVVVFHFREYVPSFGILPMIWAQGFLAVDLFFELSGFVIALNYLLPLNRDGSKISLALRFLWLRLGRIYPLHIVVLCLMVANPLAVWLFSAQGDAGDRYSLSYFVMSIFLVQNWGFSRDLAWNIPAWSISAEWFVYILFPIIAWTVLWSRLTALGWAVVALVLCSLFALVSTVWGVRLAELSDDGLFRCAVEFLIGMAVYCVWNRMQYDGKALRGDLAISMAVALMLICIFLPIPYVVVLPACFALTIYGLADTGSIISRLLACRFLEWIGMISYSTYLIHYLVRDWVKFLVIHHAGPQMVATLVYLSVTALLSVVFYKLIEMPGRNLFRKLTKTMGDRS